MSKQNTESYDAYNSCADEIKNKILKEGFGSHTQTESKLYYYVKTSFGNYTMQSQIWSTKE